MSSLRKLRAGYHTFCSGAYPFMASDNLIDNYPGKPDAGLSERAFSFFSAARISKARKRSLRNARAQLSKWIAADVRDLGLWSPVAVGIGVGVYFHLKTEPPAVLGVALAFLFTAAALLTPRGKRLWAALCLSAIGFCAADWRASHVSAPILDREYAPRSIEGRVVSVERGLRGERYVIALETIEGLPSENTPARARVTWRGAPAGAAPGDFVSLRAGLSPPPEPASPGGFDFARQLYFQKIGAVGFAVSPPQPMDAPRGKQSLNASIERLRTDLLARITEAAPGQGGAILGALVTGKRDAISEASRSALRDAGLAHLLAISGLHMGLATGIIFFSVRAALAMIEPLALRLPIKKWAALAALAGGFVYLLLSGGAWSPRRAFIMAAIIFSAILFDRRALSLRNVAIAALVILLTTPEALVHPGFQMSFAAAMALIAVYEWLRSRPTPPRDFSFGARLSRYAMALVITDVIASLATAPFALYHFNRVAVYSLPANILATPIMGFWIMPAAVAGLILTPFGLDSFVWRFAAQGVEAVLWIGATVSAWPGAVSATAQWPVSAIVLITLGGLWLALARSPLRLIGAIAIPVAMAMIANTRPPDLYMAASGTNAAVIDVDTKSSALAAYVIRREKFALDVWRQTAGLAAEDGTIVDMETVGACDEAGCVLSLKNRLIAVTENPLILSEDCARADLVVALYPISGRDWRACDAILIDRRSAWRYGAHAVWLDRKDIRIETNLMRRGERPWTGAR
ncbi:MAG: ComEC/Rec2 family competence protein [Pseudomonadota bacterium]